MATLRETLNQTINILKIAGVASPEVDARELLLFALGLNRTALLTRASEEIPASEAAKLAELVRQRAARIPLQHLLGQVEWGGLHLRTDSRALIPRPETEVLLELALQAMKPSPLTVLDIGTGTGALALGIKKAFPEALVYATDLSGEALSLARQNAALNDLDIHFVQGSLLAGLSGPFDLILSNPPYLPASDQPSADPEVQHDPALALYSGPDGLQLTRELVQQAEQHLAPTGVLLLELDPRNVQQVAAEMPGWRTEILPDLTGRRRFLRATPIQSSSLQE